MEPFHPPPSLRSPHLQTLLGRTVVKFGRGRVPEADTESTVLECCDGAKLKAMVAREWTQAPLVILIHGWLGDSESWYVIRTAHVLSAAGFRVACLAISPVIDPTATVHAIDTGWLIYRKWFVEKWRRALREKQTAFPDVYRDLDGAMRLSTVSAMTDYIVDRYLPYRDSRDYYARYDLRGDALGRLRIDTKIIAAADDVVIPGSSYAEVAHDDRVHLDLFAHGGTGDSTPTWTARVSISSIRVLEGRKLPCSEREGVSHVQRD